MQRLASRYPDLSFLLTFFPGEKGGLPRDSAPLELWLDKKDLSHVEVLYIVGLIDYPLPKKISQWLAGKPERALVFLEKEVGKIAALSDDALFAHPQIHLHYTDEDPAEMFPIDKILVFVPEGESFDALSLERRSAALSALYSDVLYGHTIARNVFANYTQLPSCFAPCQMAGAFANIPAIICGAGPSIAKTLPEVRVRNDEALIFAGGSAITALTRKGVQPHFAIALDPNEEEFDRLRQSYLTMGAFLFSPRLHKDVLATTHIPFGYIKSDTGGLVENYLEEALSIPGPSIGPELGEEAFSVTTLAIAIARHMGCNPIILTGVDLCFQGEKRYPEGFTVKEGERNDPRALEKPLQRPDITGKNVTTLLKWVMESDAIGKYAQNNPETTFLNASEAGLGFPHVKNCSLSTLDRFPKRDIYGLVHQAIQNHPLIVDPVAIDQAKQTLLNSLATCETLTKQILLRLEKGERGGKTILYESDLHDELAYRCILSGIDAALSKILFRYYPHLDPEKGKVIREVARYRELLLQIKKYQLPKYTAAQ